MSIENSLWKNSSDCWRRIGPTDDQTWRIVASRLALDNQLRKKTNCENRKSSIIENIFNSDSSSVGKEDGVDENHLDNRLMVSDPLNKTTLVCKQYNQYGQSEKWYRTLPPAEILPRNEILGGHIFVCNNDTMQEDLRRQLFGLPQKHKDSVRAITPGLPLFLYNYTTHQLHGVYQAVSFGGLNIDPTAWEDRKWKGESRFPAQVRVQIKKKCKPLEEDAFRPILYHYDGPKFRLQLSVSEALELLDLFTEDCI